MHYNLFDIREADKGKKSAAATVRKLWALVRGERRPLLLALGAILLNSVLNLVGPLIIGLTIDRYVAHGEMRGVLLNGALLLAIYVVALAANYAQTQLMGGVGQQVLFNLRNAVFNKLQELPIAFFNQNRAGDLIARINNDTDKLNQFFSQSLMRFVGSIFTMVGAGIFLLSIHPRLGAAALAPALAILLFTRLASPWIKRRNAVSLKNAGGLSAEVQESLDNFKTLVAFNRRDYFRQRFADANSVNYATAVKAGFANNLLMPVYGFFTHLAQLAVLVYGIYLIVQGQFTVGLLISFLAYADRFYSPLRQLAALWAGFQVALAGWDRVSHILRLESDLAPVPAGSDRSSAALLEFRGVRFRYEGGDDILRDVSFTLERGKTYAFIGPTGGGKTTSASLIARLYDPVKGTVFLDGRDIRSYTPAERSRRIGFILQDPFLFSGTVMDNILFGNERYHGYTEEALTAVLREAGLERLLDKFDAGLRTPVGGPGTLSLGQKQLIAFMRAVLRDPDILILDEATANIDTVTEQLLEEILKNLPGTTTRVIIAHRLNTIENADEIFFVNAGEVVAAGSMEHALQLLMDEKRSS